MDKSHLDELLKKYEAGTCSSEEREAVEKWYASYETKDEQSTVPVLDETGHQMLYSKIVSQLREEGEWQSNKSTPFIKRKIFRWAAAAILIGLAAGVYFWPTSTKNNKAISTNKNTNRFKNDISPGGNKAVLILADGSRIVLDTLQNGNIAQQGNVMVAKLNAGQLSYQNPVQNTAQIFYNTLLTPRGGQYQVDLPDGSKAWLNASSALRFPTAFSGKERLVELTGEAYFEVAKNAAMPFRVKVDEMYVEVLGTHFNVMAYTNEPAAKTTLLEGSVKVSKANMFSLLTPGQQATVNNTINVADVDTEKMIAWKNSLFWFHDADIKTVMRQIERWYDVDVIFAGNVTERFNGSIPMNMSAIKVFKVLEMTGGVHFKIDGKKITVLP